jgi:hypothetical protein
VNTEEIGEAAWVILQAIDDALTAYDGEVPETPDTNYAVLYRGGGQAVSTRLCYTPGDLTGGFQITCVGKSPRGCTWAVDLVRAAFTGTRLFPNDRASTPLREVGNPGPARRDDSVPGDRRWVTPLLYRLDTTT